jgi:hypothetical protein
VANDGLQRRRQAAEKYRPGLVRLLLVAEAPPAAPDRYSYFDDVTRGDGLFREVVRGALDEEPLSRKDKPGQLGRLRERGVFVIDLFPEPKPHPRARVDRHVDDLVERVRRLNPDHVILIKSNVYDAAYRAPEQAAQPVVDCRIPFPGSGWQREFHRRMRAALSSIGWET